MKTSIRILAGWMAVVAILYVGTAWAAPLDGSMGAWIAAASMGQSASSTTGGVDSRDEADSLLLRAREAMASDELNLADSLITAAEALDPDYGLLHLGDTPKKARRDLERKQREATGEPTGLGRLLPQPSSVTRLPQTDPFAGYATAPAGTATASGGATTANYIGPSPYDAAPLPAVGTTNPVRTLSAPSPFAGDVSPYAPTTSTSVAAMNPTRPSASPTASADTLAPRAMLLDARRALVVGDVQRAASLADRVKQLQLSYAPLDDTPEKVEEAIRQYQEVMAEPAQTDSQRRRKVRMWLGQAESLIRYKDYDSAERVATFASQEHLTYSSFEARPQDLLDRIDAARREDGAMTGSSLAGTAIAEASDLPGPSAAAKNQAVELSQAARAALQAGQLDRAELLAQRAEQLGVPDSAFARGDERPGLVLLDIRSERLRGGSGVRLASGEQLVPAAGAASLENTASRAVYEPSLDATRTVRAANQQPTTTGMAGSYELAQYAPTPAPPEAMPTGTAAPLAAAATSNGETLFTMGEAAVREGDTQRAYEYYRQAAMYLDELDSITQQRLQERLQLLSSASGGSRPIGPTGSIVDQTAAQQQALARQVATDIAHQAARAREILPTDPPAAIEMMEEAAKAVQMAGLDPTSREQLSRIVDRHVTDMQNYLQQNRARMALLDKNEQTLDEIERERNLKLATQDKLQEMVDDFNRLMQEQRYAEAEVLAKRAAELAPYEMVTQQLVNQAKFVRRYFSNLALQADKEEGAWYQLHNVEIASTGFNDYEPYQFPDSWEALSGPRVRYLREQGRPRTERELEIERKLRTPITVAFDERPLSEVLDYLAKLTEINLYLDPQGLAEEGIASNTPVTIDLRHEIMLKSALNLILEPLHLSYVVKDEVLKITSEQLRDGEVYTQTYNVADLVIPIPNFIPGETGLAAALHRALGNVGYGGNLGMGAPPLSVVASRDGGQSTGAINPGVLAQVSLPAQGGSGAGSMGYGPGGMGGSSGADFDSLIDLIINTVEPLSWDEAGGGGSIAPFGTNLSIVVSNTQEVHEQIVDLLEQLRRMQDLQVTIEVRFITLNDNFFERLGVDFDFDINDNIDRPFQVFGRADPEAETEYVTEFAANSGVARDVIDRDGGGQSVTVGMALPDLFSADLDIPFRQGSFNLAVPQFGGFAADAGAQIGFAILSDIEAFFFINAAQGDRRSNVLQAPKVTLFNGQQAMISDTSQSPFVSSVVPVVGDFAAAQQPVIVVLSEGTSMTVQAVVSNDRRFVRLTVVPFFSKIGDVNTFQFTGSETTTRSTAAEGIQDEPNDNTSNSNEETVTRSGTTVQLPTYSSVQVTTTVSVPDGGTVLLGGIKRLSEGRNEFGVPMLDKIPYINRLFKNVGIGRETQSLMMMVTPRIIIQEEEEMAQTGYTAP